MLSCTYDNVFESRGDLFFPQLNHAQNWDCDVYHFFVEDNIYKPVQQ